MFLFFFNRDFIDGLKNILEKIFWFEEKIIFFCKRGGSGSFVYFVLCKIVLVEIGVWGYVSRYKFGIFFINFFVCWNKFRIDFGRSFKICVVVRLVCFSVELLWFFIEVFFLLFRLVDF